MFPFRKRGTKRVIILIVLVCAALVFYKLVSDLEPPSITMRQFKSEGLYSPSGLHWRSRDQTITDRSIEYCNWPNKPVSGSEGVIPTGYRARMVHVFIRHGDRINIEKLSNVQQPTFLCNISNWYSSIWGDVKYKKFADHMDRQNIGDALIKDLFKRRFKKYSPYPSDYNCPLGGLTNLGALQHILLGEFFHQRYIEQINLFDNSTNRHLEVLVRSTNVGRTYQSALAFMYGFMPDLNVSEMNLMDCFDLYMCVPSFHQVCKCSLVKHLQYESSVTLNQNNQSKHDSVIDNVARALQLERHIIRSVGVVLDTILPPFCHNSTYVCSGGESSKACLDTYIDSLWDEYIASKTLYIQSHDKTYLKYSFLKLYPVLNEISQVIENRSDGENKGRLFNLYSGHDKTISALLMVFGLFDGTWPPYASRFVFEVIEPTQEPEQGKQFMRFIYNGNDVTKDVIFCKHISHPSLCDYYFFKQYLSDQLKYLFGRSKYTDACMP